MNRLLTEEEGCPIDWSDDIVTWKVPSEDPDKFQIEFVEKKAPIKELMASLIDDSLEHV